MSIRACLLALVLFAWIPLGQSVVRADSEKSTKKTEKHHHDDKADGDHDHHEAIGEKGVSTELVPTAENWRLDLSIYTLLIFVTLMAILTKYAWGPMIEALDAREERIRGNIESAEQVREQAESLLAQHSQKLDAAQDEVREIIAEAKRDAEHTKKEIEAKAQQEAKLTQDRAIDEIHRARDQALNELFETMSDQVASATEQVIGRSLSDDDRDRLVTDAVAQFSSNS